MEKIDLSSVISRETKRIFWNYDNKHTIPAWKKRYAEKLENHLWFNGKEYVFYLAYEVNNFILVYKIKYTECNLSVYRIHIYSQRANLTVDSDGSIEYTYRENLKGFRAIHQSKEFKKMRYILKKIISNYIEEGQIPSPLHYDKLDNHIIKTIKAIIGV